MVLCLDPLGMQGWKACIKLKEAHSVDLPAAVAVVVPAQSLEHTCPFHGGGCRTWVHGQPQSGSEGSREGLCSQPNSSQIRMLDSQHWSFQKHRSPNTELK